MKLNAYTLPIVISLGLHALVVGIMTWNWESTVKPEKARTPSYVPAKLVELTSKAEKQAQQAEQQKVIDVRKRRQEQERREAEQRRQREADQKVQRQAEERKLETERKAKAEREKRERDLAQRLERERLEQAERQRAQERLSEALAQEDEFMEQQEIRSQALSYLDAIGQRIEQNWSRPPSARAGMQCVLLIQFVPTGQVVNVTVTQSSGNAAFDRSAEQAVQRVGRFPEVQNMPPEVFESQFRQLRLNFNPKDLRL